MIGRPRSPAASHLPDAGLPRWPASLAVVGGAGAFAVGVAGLAGVELPGLLFNGFAALTTLWALLTGLSAWRSGRSARPSRATGHHGPAGFDGGDTLTR